MNKEDNASKDNENNSISDDSKKKSKCTRKVTPDYRFELVFKWAKK